GEGGRYIPGMAVSDIFSIISATSGTAMRVRFSTPPLSRPCTTTPRAAGRQPTLPASPRRSSHRHPPGVLGRARRGTTGPGRARSSVGLALELRRVVLRRARRAERRRPALAVLRLDLGRRGQRERQREGRDVVALRLELGLRLAGETCLQEDLVGAC